MTRIAQPDRNAPASEWTVYADALQEANDPRGELIALNQAVAKGMSTADRDAYVAKHRAALFGPAADHADSFRVTEWVGCLADAVEVRIAATESAGAVMTAFLASPLAAAHAITLAGVPTGRTTVDVSAALAKLVAQWPANARVLALVDQRAAGTTMLASRDMEPPQNLVRFGDLGGVWKLPHLEELRIAVADSHQLELGTIDAPELRHFTLENLRYSSPYEGDAPISAVLAKASWPKLESFALRCTEEYMANVIADEGAYIEYYFGNEDWEDRMDEAEIDGENVEGTNWGQLQAVLENLKKSPVKRLALTSFDSTQSLLQTIASAGLPPTLEELDLSDSSISSIDWFTENKALFFKVKKLVLDNTMITDEDAAALGSLGPTIQHKNGRAPQYRYIVGQE
jgi:hypothetical protein